MPSATASSTASYARGEPLRQDALADELGVSRIPIREALRQLEAEGLVTFSPHRGAIVSSLSLARDRGSVRSARDHRARPAARALPH
jgi:DNA-binding GntR family transcriptional regulator